MTAAELIEKLQAFSPLAEVFIYTGDMDVPEESIEGGVGLTTDGNNVLIFP